MTPRTRLQPRKWRAIKISVFTSFVIGSIIVGSLAEVFPHLPTRFFDDPHFVTIKQLHDYDPFMVGKEVMVISMVRDPVHDGVDDVMIFTIKDEFFNITYQVRFTNWSTRFPGVEASELAGKHACLRGSVIVAGSEEIIGNDVYFFYPADQYLLSIVAVILIIAMLLLFFKLDWKRLQFSTKVGEGKAREEGGESDA